MHPWKVHAWEVFDWWTSAFVDPLVEPLKRGVVTNWKFSCCFLFNKKILVLLSALVVRFGVSRMHDFFIRNEEIFEHKKCEIYSFIIAVIHKSYQFYTINLSTFL